MRRTGPGLLAGGLGLLLVPWACHRTEPLPDPPADADLDADLEEDAGLDADGDHEADADGPPLDGDVQVDPGPITLVVTELWVTTTRACDLDGDGDLDNVIADLGSSTADLAAMALNAALQGSIEHEDRFLVHAPWVDDRAGLNDPDALLLQFEGIDGDVPPDRSDDLLGGEGFWADPSDLDACGEPRFYIGPLAVERGVVSSDPGVWVLPLGSDIVTRGARASGTVGPGGLSADVEICSYAAIPDLGGESGLEEAADLTMLETFLAGGEAFGVSMIPGFRPDVDLDRDGLESFVVDSEHHIVRCVDGDLTTWDGRDCWQDERMADGFSMNVRLVGLHALFLGRYPGWEEMVEGTCDDPPERSLFDPT